jgi:hypothetical protein
MKTKSRLLYLLLSLLTAALACNLPSIANSTPQAATADALQTSVAQTINAVESTSTYISAQTYTGIPSPINSLLTLTPVSTATPLMLCNAAYFVKDITIPDGTVLGRGRNFTKVWRIQNIGTCTWTPSYSVVFISGDRLSGVTITPLSNYVYPGNYIDLAIDMTAPSSDGHYEGFWELRDVSGALFGIGPQADNPFWVDIYVSGPSYKAYDFISSFCDATWQNDTGNLPCPGSIGDPIGYVLNLDNPMMESGKTEDEPGLLTVPKDASYGFIRGVYPSIQIQYGDRFRALVNCQYQAYGCDVIFKLNYQIGGSTYTLGQWHEIYDGLYTPIDLDLSSLAGQNVIFKLVVNANNYSHQDRALWIAPRIVRPGVRPTSTGTNVATATFTSTSTATNTATATNTSTSTNTATATNTSTATNTATSTATPP